MSNTAGVEGWRGGDGGDGVDRVDGGPGTQYPPPCHAGQRPPPLLGCVDTTILSTKSSVCVCVCVCVCV